MPTELPGFRRPRPPRIDEFTDELERQLVQIIADRPPRQVPRWRLNLERCGRYLVRPLVNGAMIAALAVTIAISLPASSDPLVNDLASHSRETRLATQWAEVESIPDPTPGYVPSRAYFEGESRFVKLVPSAPAGHPTETWPAPVYA